MPRSVKRKAQPLSMRLGEADVAIIDRAAGLRGRSRTDFVREAAVRAAEEVLLERTLIRMSPAGFAAFRAAIEAPGRRYRSWSSCCAGPPRGRSAQKAEP